MKQAAKEAGHEASGWDLYVAAAKWLLSNGLHFV
jgi:hypothetical protein